VARKDRARARKRRAIERARREGGTPPPRPAQRERPRTGPRGGDRPAGRQRTPARGAGPRGSQYATKGKVGDPATTGFLGRRQVVRTRDMLLHPRITVRVVIVAFLLALPGIVLPWFDRTDVWLQPLTFASFGVCFLGLADLAPTWRQTVPLAIFAVMSLVLAAAQLLAATNVLA
jgi:hypothetical protein